MAARRIIVPADAVWDDFFDLAGIDIGEREQPPVRRVEGLRTEDWPAGGTT
jgi:antitoxin VapB